VAEVRIHLAKMSALLSRMITDLLASERDMKIVGSTEGSQDSLAAARAEGANLIITQQNPSIPEPSLAAILDDLPLTILAIGPNGSTGTSINFSRQTVQLQGDGASALADVVRQAAELA
jgi:hypothetical protein